MRAGSWLPVAGHCACLRPLTRGGRRVGGAARHHNLWPLILLPPLMEEREGENFISCSIPVSALIHTHLSQALIP